MTVHLYNSSADYRVANKSNYLTLLTGVGGLSCRPTEKINMISPEFVVDYNAAYLNCNYLYCSDFDRYYFVSNPRFDSGGRLVLPCQLDIRMTANLSIRGTSATVTRSESIGNPTQIPDKMLPVNPSKKQITSIVLPETTGLFDTDAEYSYLLTVIGGTPAV